jgi:hypothetical protein
MNRIHVLGSSMVIGCVMGSLLLAVAAVGQVPPSEVRVTVTSDRPPAAGAQVPIGCAINSVSDAQIDVSTITRRLPRSLVNDPSQSYPDEENAFHALKASIVERFYVSPRVYFFDDGNAPNAFATGSLIVDDPTMPKPNRRSNVDGTLLIPGADGTVLVGTSLLRLEWGEHIRSFRTATENAVVAAILAHEFGHVAQDHRGCPFPRGKWRELQADYLAGWYIHKEANRFRTLRDTVFDSSKAARAFYMRGDTAFHSPNHHGTKEERLNAFLSGFKNDVPEIGEAYAASERYTRDLGGGETRTGGQ